MVDRVTMNMHAIGKLKHWCGFQDESGCEGAPVLVLANCDLCFWQSH